MSDTEIVFQAWESPEGGYEARAVGYSIFTEANDWEHLKSMLRDAVLCHFDEGEAPSAIRIHIVQAGRFDGGASAFRGIGAFEGIQ